jgi:hypothetical protein
MHEYKQTLVTHHLFSLAVVLQSRRKCSGSEQCCNLALCLISGVTVSSQTHDICLLDDVSCYSAANISRDFYNLFSCNTVLYNTISYYQRFG